MRNPVNTKRHRFFQRHCELQNAVWKRSRRLFLAQDPYWCASPAPSSRVSRSSFPRQKGRVESDASANRCCGEETRFGALQEEKLSFYVFHWGSNGEWNARQSFRIDTRWIESNSRCIWVVRLEVADAFSALISPGWGAEARISSSFHRFSALNTQK